MNTKEQRILHGLYFGGSQNLTSSNKYRSEEILWLMNTKIPKTATWRMPNGGFQWIESESGVDYIDISQSKHRAWVPLSHLKESDILRVKIQMDFSKSH